MPIAISASEATYSVGSSAVRLDASPTSNRFWVQVVNPSDVYRVFVGYDSNVGTANHQCADPSFGIWEMPVNSQVPIWVKAESGTITVRFIEYRSA